MKLSDIVINKPVDIYQYYRYNEAIFIFDDYIWVLEEPALGKELNKYDSVEAFRKMTGMDKDLFYEVYFQEDKNVIEQFQKQNNNIKNILICEL